MTPYALASAINAQVNASTSYCFDAMLYGRPEFWDWAVWLCLPREIKDY